MGRFQWDKNNTDQEILNGSIITDVRNTTSSDLQIQVEFISEVIGIKLDFKLEDGRYFIMCKNKDYTEVMKRWGELGKIISSLQDIYREVIPA